jgi:small subunit ribosomal protein S16
MAVKLRLMRMGKKKQPTYRVVAADARSPRNGRFIEVIGTYEPRQDPSVIVIDNERAVHWLQNGAQPTDRVAKLLKISGAWTEHTGETVDSSVPDRGPRKSRKQVEKEAEAAAAAEAEAEEAAAADEAVDEAPEAVADDADAPADEATEEAGDE